MISIVHSISILNAETVPLRDVFKITCSNAEMKLRIENPALIIFLIESAALIVPFRRHLHIGAAAAHLAAEAEQQEHMVYIEFGPVEEIKCQRLIQEAQKSGTALECFGYFQIQMSRRLSPFTGAGIGKARIDGWVCRTGNDGDRYNLGFICTTTSIYY